MTLVKSPLRTNVPHHAQSTKRAVKLTTESVATVVGVDCDSIRDVMSSLCCKFPEDQKGAYQDKHKCGLLVVLLLLLPVCRFSAANKRLLFPL